MSRFVFHQATLVIRCTKSSKIIVIIIKLIKNIYPNYKLMIVVSKHFVLFQLEKINVDMSEQSMINSKS